MLKIATYNLRNLFDAGQRPGYGDQVLDITPEYVEGVVKNLTSDIAAISPDLLVAQEVASATVFERIAKSLNGDYRSFIVPPDKRGIGNAALTKSDVRFSSLNDFDGFPVMTAGASDNIGSQMESARHFALAELIYENKPLYVVGIHLKSGIPLPLIRPDGEKIPNMNQSDEGDSVIRATMFRLAQARYLRQFTDSKLIIDPAAQIIILGDFNASEFSDVLKIIKGSPRFPESQLINLTESTPKEHRFSFIYHGEKNMIDHVLISKSLENNVLNFEILNAGLIDQSNAPETDFLTSDHAPVVLTLK